MPDIAEALMSDKADANPSGGKKDSAEFSGKAPENDEKVTRPDPRLIPGGAHGASANVGMTAVEPDAVPASQGRTTLEHPERVR
jgi:hypothetical protein